MKPQIPIVWVQVYGNNDVDGVGYHLTDDPMERYPDAFPFSVSFLGVHPIRSISNTCTPRGRHQSGK
jgi:hypothetical protein